MVQIYDIKRNFFRNRQRIAAIDLRPARKTRHQRIHTRFRSQTNEVALWGRSEAQHHSQGAPEFLHQTRHGNMD